MNFSKLKLTEGMATSNGTQAYTDAANKAMENSTAGKEVHKSTNLDRQSNQRMNRAQKAKPAKSGTMFSSHIPDHGEYFKEMRDKIEYKKAVEANKSDWRTELQEKVNDGVEREQHPFVTVMPTGDEALIQAMKQMGGEVKGKKKEMEMQKEEVVELEEKEKKPKCKEGYKYNSDTKRCEKKEKSSKTYVGGWGLGHHHHHDDDDDNGSDTDGGGGGDAGGGDGGGGMGEMFDILGDMILKEKTLSIKDQMKMAKKAAKSRNPNPDHRAIRGAQLAKAPVAKDERTDAQKMTDATGPRPGSRYRGD